MVRGTRHIQVQAMEVQTITDGVGVVEYVGR
jgi:hypothetical protein